ncbi:MAG TPA: hypothetical protein VKA83_09440 [Methylomirabilota bacterium]|nr:hypothetical protein [Methylomirabilota bacterium]
MTRYLTKRVQVIAAVLAALTFLPGLIWAASPNFPALGSSVFPVIFHLSGQSTATKTNIARFTAPVNMRALYATAYARAKGGSNVNSHGATNVQLLNNGVAMTTSGMDLGNPAAGTMVEASLLSAQQNIARDTALSADLTVWGSAPTIDDITVTVWVQRRN